MPPIRSHVSIILIAGQDLSDRMALLLSTFHAANMDFRTFLKSKMALLTSDHGNRYTATGKFMTVPVLNVSPGRQLWHWAGRCELTVPQPPATRPGPARALPCCPPRCVGPARAAVSALLPSLLCPPLLCASRAARCPQVSIAQKALPFHSVPIR